MIHIFYYICILNVYVTSRRQKLCTVSCWNVGPRISPDLANPSDLSMWWCPIVFIFIGTIPNLLVLLLIFVFSIWPFRSNRIASVFAALFAHWSYSYWHHAVPHMSVLTPFFLVHSPFWQVNASEKPSKTSGTQDKRLYLKYLDRTVLWMVIWTSHITLDYIILRIYAFSITR